MPKERSKRNVRKCGQSHTQGSKKNSSSNAIIKPLTRTYFRQLVSQGGKRERKGHKEDEEMDTEGNSEVSRASAEEEKGPEGKKTQTIKLHAIHIRYGLSLFLLSSWLSLFHT